jgi:superfamily II DNA/RNA helicase
VRATLQATPQVIVLAPTRPLVLQIFEEFMALSGVPSAEFEELTKTGIASTDFGGGKLSMRILAADWKIPTDSECESQIVVGTPDRIKNLLTKRQLDGRNIKLLILDEADEMVREGKGTQSAEDIKKKLLSLQSGGGGKGKGKGKGGKGKGKGGKGRGGGDDGGSGGGAAAKFQMLLFSATFDRSTWRFATAMTSFAPCAHIRQKASAEGNNSDVRKVHFKVDPNQETDEADVKWGAGNEVNDPMQLRKMNALDDMYAYMDVSKSIIFCNTRFVWKHVHAFVRGGGGGGKQTQPN